MTCARKFSVVDFWQPASRLSILDRPEMKRVWSGYVKKIYVGNLPWNTTDDDLRELFATYGAVESSAVVNDRETGRPRGFGFVEMGPPDADKAIAELDGRDYGGRALRVNEALDKRRAGGGGAAGGGGGHW